LVQLERAQAAGRAFVKAVGSNPRVPLASCTGNAGELRPRGVDLLFPIQLGNYSPEPGLMARPVTVIGKLVLNVRNQRGGYVDDESEATFGNVLLPLDKARGFGQLGGLYTDRPTFSNELTADVTVIAPGALIIPIAIYR
jgi:hypothetical protein